MLRVVLGRGLRLHRQIKFPLYSSAVSVPTESDPALISKELVAATGVSSVLNDPEYEKRPKDQWIFSDLRTNAPHHLTYTVALKPRKGEKSDVELDKIEDYGSLEEYIGLKFGKDFPSILDELKPERDRENFPRPALPVYQPHTRMHFLPERWFDAFYDKTGVTGPYLFGATFGTFLVSKEFYVLDHDFPWLCCWIFFIYQIMTKVGDKMNLGLEARIWRHYEEWELFRNGTIKTLESIINNAKGTKQDMEDELMIYDAKRENVKFQLEEEFRKRQLQVYNEAVRKLEFQVALQDSQKKINHTHMVNWIIQKVYSSITPEQEKVSLNQCIQNLKQLNSKGVKI